MPSVIVVDPDGREYPVMTAEALVWAVYGRGAELKSGTYQQAIETLQGGDPPAPNTMRHVTLADLADFYSPAAVSVRAGLENATAVNPTGSWDFEQAPTVNGQPMAGGSAPVQSVNTKTGAVVLDAADVGAATEAYVGTQVATRATPAYVDAQVATKTDVTYVDTQVATRAPTSHTHTAANISDSTATGRSVLTAATNSAARTAIGAGTSNLAIGTTGTTAAAGNDARLSDARTPTAHTHVATTDLTATGTKDATTYLRGDNTWATVPGGTPADATTTSKGIVQLAGDLAGTAAAPTVPGLAGKANTSHTHTATNISDSTATGRSVLTATDATAARTAIGAGTSSLALGTTAGTAAAGNDARLSDARTPTAHNHAIADLTATGTRDATTFLRGDGTWSTTPAAQGAADASTTVKGLVQLAGDLAGTATAPTVPGLAGKANTSHTHTAANISDSTATGRSVMTAVDATAARTAIGAGTSNLALGTTSTTAKAGDYTPPVDQVAGTASMRTLGTGATQAAAGNDSRLSDARTPTAHTHVATAISDSTATGRSVLTATDAAAARTAIGAGTGNSNLALGTTSTTAKAGDYAPPADAAAGTASMRTLGTGATQAAAGNDSRLSDARTPTTHTHTASQVSDSSTIGRTILTAADAAAVRAATGAGRVDSSDATVLNVVKITAAAHATLVTNGTTVATTMYNIVG